MILIETLIEETLTAVILYAPVRTVSVQTWSVQNEVLLTETVLNVATPNETELQTLELPNEVFQIVRLVVVARSYQAVKVAMVFLIAVRSWAAHFWLAPRCESVPHFWLALQCESVPRFWLELQFEG